MNSIKEMFKNKNTRLSIRVMLSLLMIFIVYISPALFTFLSNGILGNIVFLFSLFVFVFLDIRLAVVMIPIFILINIFYLHHMELRKTRNLATDRSKTVEQEKHVKRVYQDTLQMECVLGAKRKDV